MCRKGYLIKIKIKKGDKSKAESKSDEQEIKTQASRYIKGRNRQRGQNRTIQGSKLGNHKNKNKDWQYRQHIQRFTTKDRQKGIKISTQTPKTGAIKKLGDWDFKSSGKFWVMKSSGVMKTCWETVGKPVVTRHSIFIITHTADSGTLITKSVIVPALM